MNRFVHIFDEVRRRNINKNAANSTVIVVVIAALVIGLLGWWAVGNRTQTANSLVPGDVDPDTVLGNNNQVMPVPPNAVTPTSTASSTRSGATSTLSLPASVRAQARTDLVAIQTRLEAQRNYEEAASATNALESRLEKMYASSTGEARAEWIALTTQFDRLEQGLRQQSADSLSALSGLILFFENSVRNGND